MRTFNELKNLQNVVNHNNDDTFQDVHQTDDILLRKKRECSYGDYLLIKNDWARKCVCMKDRRDAEKKME